MRNSLEPLHCRALLMMLLLIANVVYHPLQILRAETHYTLTSLPIQQLAICEFMIYVMRTRALEFSNPAANQKRRRNRHRDVHVCFDPADFVKYQTL